MAVETASVPFPPPFPARRRNHQPAPPRPTPQGHSQPQPRPAAPPRSECAHTLPPDPRLHAHAACLVKRRQHSGRGAGVGSVGEVGEEGKKRGQDEGWGGGHGQGRVGGKVSPPPTRRARGAVIRSRWRRNARPPPPHLDGLGEWQNGERVVEGWVGGGQAAQTQPPQPPPPRCCGLGGRLWGWDAATQKGTGGGRAVCAPGAKGGGGVGATKKRNAPSARQRAPRGCEKHSSSAEYGRREHLFSEARTSGRGGATTAGGQRRGG